MSLALADRESIGIQLAQDESRQTGGLTVNREMLVQHCREK